MLQILKDQSATIVHWQQCFANINYNEAWKFEMKTIKLTDKLAFKFSIKADENL